MCLHTLFWTLITTNWILTIVKVMAEPELTSGLWLMGGKWKAVKLGSVSVFTLLMWASPPQCLTKANTVCRTSHLWLHACIWMSYMDFIDFKWSLNTYIQILSYSGWIPPCVHRSSWPLRVGCIPKTNPHTLTSECTSLQHHLHSPSGCASHGRLDP